MRFRSDWSLVFHPDPEIFPALKNAPLNGGLGVLVKRPGYRFPVYLDLVLEPGTVLLTRTLVELGAKSISAYQSFIFEDDDYSRWSHVGIIGGDGCVWDANPGHNIRARSVSEFLETVDIVHARKLVSAKGNSRILQEVILEQSRSRYPQFANRKVFSYFLKYMIAGKAPNSIPFEMEELICSSFVDRVIREAYSIEPFPEAKPPIALPGHYAQSTAFECVPLRLSIYRVDAAAQ